MLRWTYYVTISDRIGNEYVRRSLGVTKIAEENYREQTGIS